MVICDFSIYAHCELWNILIHRIYLNSNIKCTRGVKLILQNTYYIKYFQNQYWLVLILFTWIFFKLINIERLLIKETTWFLFLLLIMHGKHFYVLSYGLQPLSLQLAMTFFSCEVAIQLPQDVINYKKGSDPGQPPTPASLCAAALSSCNDHLP